MDLLAMLSQLSPGAHPTRGGALTGRAPGGSAVIVARCPICQSTAQSLALQSRPQPFRVTARGTNPRCAQTFTSSDKGQLRFLAPPAAPAPSPPAPDSS